MAKVDDKTSTWTPLRADMLEAWVPRLLAGRIVARHGGIWLRGKKIREAGPVDRVLWAKPVRADPDTGALIFEWARLNALSGGPCVEERVVTDVEVPEETPGAGQRIPAGGPQLALLPEEPGEPEASGAGEWVAAEAGRMKDAGELVDIRITHFARELERRMCEAAKLDSSIRPVGWGYIKNNLRGWGLWPVSRIK